MRVSRLPAAQHIIDGTTRVFLADALILPTNLLTVVFLTRRLGPDGFGLFAIASSIVLWIEASINTIFFRPTLKTVADHHDWRDVGATIVRLHLRVSVAAGLIMMLLTPFLGTLLRQPGLLSYLWLFSIDIPLAGLTDAHRNLLVGSGGFRQRALASSARWIGRLLLIVTLVEIGLSVYGVILGNIGGSLIELVIVRAYIRPPLWNLTKVSLPGFWNCFWPLVLFSISIAVFNKLDLLILKMLGATTDQAGIYAAGQALAVVPGIFAMSFSPLLLSTVSGLIRCGDIDAAKKISLQAMRVIIVLLPFAGMTAGMSEELVDLVFGPVFRPAAPVLSLLIFAALAMAMLAVVSAILTAAGKPNLVLLQGAILLPLAVAGHFLLIPRFGLIGASTVTTCCAIFGALGSIAAVYRVWDVLPPIRTVIRASIVCAIAFAFASGWPGLQGFVILKIFVISLGVGVLFFVFREFGATEIRLVKSLMSSRISPNG